MTLNGEFPAPSESFLYAAQMPADAEHGMECLFNPRAVAEKDAAIRASEMYPDQQDPRRQVAYDAIRNAAFRRLHDQYLAEVSGGVN
ncbi:MAG: hypothetical protein JWP13_439 [Candidatus Saccharibacteria bacterium]|nr:hypothetical protein [Candidatus Saccharibacteria bacterium]